MNPNLLTPYMTGEIERGMLDAKAAKAQLTAEAAALNPRQSLAGKARHALAVLLMAAGERLEGRTATMYSADLDDALGPVSQAQP